MKTIMLLLMTVLLSQLVYAQGFEPARKIRYVKIPGTIAPQTRGLNSIFNSDSDKAKEDSLLGTGSELFQQLAFNITNSTPRINVKAVKLYAKVGKNQYIDFYILSSIPSLTTNPLDSAKDLGNELQNLYGGLLNSYFSKTWYFNKEDDKETRGFQIDIKGGYKLTETSKNSGTKNIYLHSGQIATELRFLIPLFGTPSDENRAGLAQFKVNGQMLYNKNPDYTDFFTKADGTKPSDLLISSTIEGSIHVFNQFYVSGGYAFNSISTIDNFGYFKLTYSR